MSTITKPILLDSTGQDINATLQGILKVLQAQSPVIDDNITSDTTVWSSQKITNALTSLVSVEGQEVSIEPIAATPIEIISVVEEPASLILKHAGNGKTIHYEIAIPQAGSFNWSTGILTLEDGSISNLEGFSIMAFPGTNTLSINNGTMTLNYHTLAAGGSTCDCSWDIISGGSAAEEE